MEFTDAAIETIPQKPGTYRFYDSDMRCLYVGRAKNLKGRIRMHISNRKFLVLGLGGQVVDVVLDWVRYFEVEELPHNEAIRHESELISKLRPPLNSESSSDLYAMIQARYQRHVFETFMKPALENMKDKIT
jgi:excinuclease UvrABC nuclease subunit